MTDAPAREPIRVLVADDHPAVRSGLVALLDSAEDITVVAEASDGAAAITAAREHHPEVVLTDVRMPGATGIEITPQLRETGAHVLVISGFDLDDYVLGALAAGADGYLVKSEDPQRILAAVRDVHRGDAVLSAAATRAVVGALRGRQSPGPGQEAEASGAPGATGTAGAGLAIPVPEPAFTRREEEVLALVAQGLSNQQVASQLFVEITTVKSHLSHVLAKLQVDSRVQAALWWQQHRG
ncbi:response regulator [Brachybacterium sacelli]|uniref:DNA-binding NarL/FixJ family response regulator n=1 Tax=Brachybacterium sacelli TaxID=173364 RepID=A0ABS4WZI5_9MICO|nr:DNA-binding NarL/FixJ family response regulator [Brachybacterium sacelli]